MVSGGRAGIQNLRVYLVIPRIQRPVVVLGGSEQYFPLGRMVKLTCVAPGPLADKVRWVRVNGSLPADHETPAPGVLVFPEFEVSDPTDCLCKLTRHWQQ